MMSKTLQLSNNRIAHYFEQGEGEPLVLIHGVGMQAAAWYPQIEYFSKHYHVILDATPAEGVTDASYAEALKHASLTINVYLAKLAIGQKADETEEFEMGPVGPGKDGKPLPKVAYLVTHMASHDTWNF